MKVKKDYLQLLILCAVAVLLIIFSPKAKYGASNGITLCEEIIIPGLLPLLIIFNLIIKTDAGRAVDNILAFFTEKALRLPKCAGCAVLFGLIGGYPTGAILTEQLFDNNDIDSETAMRLLRFNVNGGAAFIITAVGSGILKNQKAGVILFISTTLSALSTAIFSSFGYDKPEKMQGSFFSMRLEDGLNAGVESALKSILKMSSYIIIFSALNEIISFPPAVSPLVEITGGISASHRLFTLPEIAFLLSFSGICIHFQLISIIKKIKMKYLDFLLWRIINGALSYLICTALTAIFPTDITVFSNMAEVSSKASYVSPALSWLLIFGCAVFVFDLENKKKKC